MADDGKQHGPVVDPKVGVDPDADKPPVDPAHFGGQVLFELYVEATSRVKGRPIDFTFRRLDETNRLIWVELDKIVRSGIRP